MPINTTAAFGVCTLQAAVFSFFGKKNLQKKKKFLWVVQIFLFQVCREEECSYFWGKKTMELEVIKNKIYEIRGQRVMLDRDLAQLYGVETKVLNQAVKRNQGRFPNDFMFRLTKEEMRELVTNCDRFEKLKHSSTTSCAFTEQGVAMLSSVLKSERAVLVNISIMRTFVMMRNYVTSVVSAPAEFSEFKERLQLIEQSCKDNADAVSELGEDVQKEMDDIYLALSQLAARQRDLETIVNTQSSLPVKRNKIGYK